MKTTIKQIQRISFDDVQVTIEEENMTGELHLKDASELAIGDELELSKPGIASKTSNFLSNLFGTSDEALKTKNFLLQNALNEANEKIKALETLNTESNGN